MSDGIQALTEREKEALRLLIGGHDIKSISVRLGLSVHTVNERLREARRKLGVSSSRQAARLLAEREPHGPDFSGDRQSGVVHPSVFAEDPEPSGQRGAGGSSLAWLGGGMLVMSLIVAAVVFSSALQGTGELRRPAPSMVVTAASAVNAADAPGANAARNWVELLDGQRWSESWGAAGLLFRTQLSQDSWTSKAQAVRQQMGPASSRILQTVTKAASLPGAPDGEYEIIQFATNFEHKHDAIETVVLAHEPSGWKVDGYFIK